MDTNEHEWEMEERDGFLCRMLGRCARYLGMSPAACAVRIVELTTEYTEDTELEEMVLTTKDQLDALYAEKHTKGLTGAEQPPSPKVTVLKAGEQRRAFLEGLQTEEREDTGSRIREACPTKNEKEEG